MTFVEQHRDVHIVGVGLEYMFVAQPCPRKDAPHGDLVASPKTAPATVDA